MYEVPLIALVTLLVVGGGVTLLQHIPVPDNYKDREYRRHLTQAEKATLAQGKRLDKVHKAYQSIWRNYYDQGPLRVEPAGAGAYTFTPYGHWQRLTNAGHLEAEWGVEKSGPESHWRQYLPDGSLDFILYSVPYLLEGDTAVEARMVYFTRSGPKDTAAVAHHFYKGHQEVRKPFFSYDSQGRRPVPEGWKLTRP